MTLNPPRIILITGVGGIGKTTLISGTSDFDGLAARLGNTKVVSKDALGDRFTKSRGSDYMKTYRPSVYEEVYQLTRKYAFQGQNVIVDASHRSQIQKPGWEKVYADIAKETGTILKIIRLIAPVEVLWERIQRRASSYDADKDTHSPETLAKWYAQHEPIEVPMPQGSLIVDARGDMEDVMQRIIQFV